MPGASVSADLKAKWDAEREGLKQRLVTANTEPWQDDVKGKGRRDLKMDFSLKEGKKSHWGNSSNLTH